jgi:hypothetical protein
MKSRRHFYFRVNPITLSSLGFLLVLSLVLITHDVHAQDAIPQE